MHLLMIATLYAAIVSILALLFQYTNIKFPDPLSYDRISALDIIRRSMAALVVVLPVFIFMSHLIARDIKRNPEKQELKIRKWLLYLTLLAASATIIIDLVTLINGFLSGELTARFLLKTVSVLVVTACVFGYYLWDLRRAAQKKSLLPRNAAIAASIISVLVIAFGFFFVGSPQTQRQMRFDNERVNHLQILQSEIISYWQVKGALPANLTALENQITGFRAPVDPLTAKQYEYTISDELVFELCAEFALQSENQSTQISRNELAVPMPAKPDAYYNPYDSLQTWNHNAGRACFERTIDPDLYPSEAFSRKGWNVYRDDTLGFLFQYPAGYGAGGITGAVQIIADTNNEFTPSMTITVEEDRVEFALWEGIAWDYYKDVVSSFRFTK